MAECCHYRHGNAAKSEIKNEFQKKTCNCYACCNTSIYKTYDTVQHVGMETVPKQAATKKICERIRVWRRIHTGQGRNNCAEDKFESDVKGTKNYTDQILGTNLLQKLPGSVFNFSVYLSVIFSRKFSVTITDKYMKKLKTLPRSF